MPEQKARKPKCHNCKHAGTTFRIANMTHMHCEQPDYNQELIDAGEMSPWETLREFWHTCDRHEFKEPAAQEVAQ